MELMCSDHGPESVTVAHSCCLSKFMGSSGCLGARWRLMPTCPTVETD